MEPHGDDISKSDLRHFKQQGSPAAQSAVAAAVFPGRSSLVPRLTPSDALDVEIIPGK